MRSLRKILEVVANAVALAFCSAYFLAAFLIVADYLRSFS
jgi:hypothetical protein